MAVSFEDAQKKIESRFANNWTETPIAYDNVQYTPPTGLKEWVRITVLPGDSGLIGLDGVSGLVRSAGEVVVQIYTVQSVGTARANGLADLVSTIFRNVTADGILYRTPSVIKLGVNPGGWYQLNVSASYQWDHTY